MVLLNITFIAAIELRDASASRSQSGVMESDDENEMVERFRGASLSLRNDKGPVWDGRRGTWSAFWYDMYVFLKCCNDGKLVKTVDGADREDRLAADETVRNAYARRNLLVWRYMIRSIDKHCRTSKAVRLMIIDDFREDHDGYELIQYLNAYASERSDIDVDKLRTRIEKMSGACNAWTLGRGDTLRTYGVISSGQAAKHKGVIRSGQRGGY